jgi:hypothetical protein
MSYLNLVVLAGALALGLMNAYQAVTGRRLSKRPSVRSDRQMRRQSAIAAVVLIGLALASLVLVLASLVLPSVSDARAVASTTAAPTEVLAAGAFHLERLPPGTDGTTAYRAFTGADQRCEFVVRLRQSTSAQTASIEFASASIERRGATDCTQFLRALAPELGFSGPLPAIRPTQSISLEAALLGTHQSRSHGPGGGFSSTPPGPWLLLKLFFNDDEGEVFLNLNPEDGIGEFALKDQEYATVVVTELAKVLLPSKPVAKPVLAADTPTPARR